MSIEYDLFHYMYRLQLFIWYWYIIECLFSYNLLFVAFFFHFNYGARNILRFFLFYFTRCSNDVHRFVTTTTTKNDWFYFISFRPKIEACKSQHIVLFQCVWPWRNCYKHLFIVVPVTFKNKDVEMKVKKKMRMILIYASRTWPDFFFNTKRHRTFLGK